MTLLLDNFIFWTTSGRVVTGVKETLYHLPCLRFVTRIRFINSYREYPMPISEVMKYGESYTGNGGESRCGCQSTAAQSIGGFLIGFLVMMILDVALG